ncbi:Transcriptional regulatory protein DegU [bioreactor metagenome]|uniref:Transcriptional regulatory protein DegU n=1 Tax=bioreactor metagenome TaxID=1076179 RepID=A0A644TRL3_9ZZZZ|nr:response regulator transcription factor [Lentimicrobium sp.]MEA5110446.1 response regulator transcription factor [Lentimicrobium sp.]
MNNLKPFSVYLVDDHKLFREGLNLLLGNLPYISQVFQAPDGGAFLSGLNRHVPELVLMDISMPGLDGIETTRKALELIPNLKIIALSMYADEDYTSRMISAGARGFILKNSGLHEVEECLKAVMSGHNYFSPEILDGILKNISKKEKQPRNSELSERETEVLYRICQGLSNQEIAGLLRISKRTVDKHRENLLQKTNSKNTAGLVMFAIRNGIVEV